MTRTYDRERVLLADAFNAEYYLQELPEISHESLDPLVHYLEQGWRDLLDPSPHFSTSFYLEAHPDVREQGVNPLLHYVESGRAEGRITRETSKRYAYERTIIASAFDIEYYLTQLPELRNSTVDPIIHYLQKGWQELRDPSADFSTSYYLQAHPDVREQGVNPLLHYVQFGRLEGRATHAHDESESPAGADAPRRPAAATTHHAAVDAHAETDVVVATLQVGATARMAGVEGYVDSLARSGATGWAWMPETPTAVVQVEAVLDGRVLGRTAANLPRRDLAELGKGTGRHGFELTFFEYLTGDRAPTMRVLGPEGPTNLHGADALPPEAPPPAPRVAPPPPAGVTSVTVETAIEGAIDTLTRGGASGWVWIPSVPEASVQLEALLNGVVIGRATADQLRTDLLAHGKGTGLYGFKMSFTEHVVGDEVPIFRALAPVAQALPQPTGLPNLTQADMSRRSRGTMARFAAEHMQFTSQGPLFEEFDPSILASTPALPSDAAPLLIAFYLPQFHAIVENDEFWGSGFTEWRQLPRGSSRFPGHYQPRVPRDLGFYNLENIETIRAQAALAKAAGIGAFAFYYYWFNRKRVLEKPLNLLLDSDLDMPFMIIWANENWTRTWDGSESQILLKQDYAREDEIPLLADLARHFADKRYVRLNGRPLFVIYNPKNIPDTATTIARWRRILALQFGIDVLIFMAQTFGERDPRVFGLDGAIEFPPHKLSDHLPTREATDAYSEDYSGRILAYDDFVTVSLSEDDADFPLIKTIVPSWDNDARRPNRGLTLEGHTPAKYEAWLRALILRALDSAIYGRPVVAINAWNEWAEGAYLEPDVYYGSSFLNATARAYVSALREHHDATAHARVPRAAPPAITAILPNFNHARYLPERIRSVVEQTLPVSEIIFLDDCSSDDSIDIARDLLEASGLPFRIVANTENSGSVFRQWAKGISLATHDLVWIAETDDSCDAGFLSHVAPAFAREDVMASFGHITCIDHEGTPRHDLDHYLDELQDFSWQSSGVVPAYRAFSHDFAIKNVIPNASGLVFRKPCLTEAELRRLFQYRFAGDWYFYALIARGASIAYSRKARSFFRVNRTSTSRSAFFTHRHLIEHQMIIRDLREQYGIGEAVIAAHAAALAVHFDDWTSSDIRDLLADRAPETAFRRPIRMCIAAHSFAVGGGELLPVALANEFRRRGAHVTYLVIERGEAGTNGSIRSRLRRDIPVVYWDDVSHRFAEFLHDYGIEVVNSHNVSVEFQLFLRKVDLPVPYIASLHGGYETVPQLLTEDFVGYLNRHVTEWLHLAHKNIDVLASRGVNTAACRQSFNAVEEFAGEWIDRQGFREHHEIAQDAFVLVQCSRAIHEKGWQTAIDVVASLAGRSPRPVHLVLIGDGPDAADIKARNAGRADVTFMGHVDSPIRYLRCCDLGIFPSVFRGETFPLFLLECFQAGLPVVSTDIGETPRIMGERTTGRPGAMVSHAGGDAEIAREMIAIVGKILADEAAYVAMCKAAGEASMQFGFRQLGDFYEQVFRAAVASGSDAGC